MSNGADQAAVRSKAMVWADDVRKRYTVGKTVLDVLKGASLEVAKGERVAIIGLSGAGKSTLLHILGGLDRPDTGSVWIGGESVYDLAEGARAVMRATEIGFVFQSYHLLPEMDVMENVMLPARARRSLFADSRAARDRASALLESVGLAGRVEHMPVELSGGEQQRVALARALMNDPKVVLADEPTGNLDAATGRQVLDNLFSLTGNRAHTLVMVTHNEEIARSCDRVLRLREGRLVRA